MDAARNIGLVLLTSILSFRTTSDGADTQDYCKWDTFRASCSSDEVVVIDGARYGRMNHGKCIQHNLGFVGCSKDVLHLADYMCSGRRRCEMTVPSAALDRTEPCLADITSYLEIGYSCKQVIIPESRSCRSLKSSRLTRAHGFLSSLITAETGCGAETSPWSIEAKSGQRINVTLWNFSVEKTSDLVRSSGTSSCLKYATLSEAENRHGKTICGEFPRMTHVYTSIGNTLDVRIYAMPLTNPGGTYFLLEYQIIGCADPVIPEGSTYKRHGSNATVGCEASHNTWTLECRGTQWVGEFGTCIRKATSDQGFRFPSVLSVVIIICISLLIGLLILSLGLLYLCRRQRNGARHQMQTTPLDGADHMVYNPSLMAKSMIDPVPVDMTNIILHPYERESNDYASIWEWPMPPGPVSSAASGDDSNVPEPYQGRLSTASHEKPEHPYQLPGTASSAQTAYQHQPYVRDDFSSVVGPRYFELDSTGRPKAGRQRDLTPDTSQASQGPVERQMSLEERGNSK